MRKLKISWLWLPVWFLFWYLHVTKIMLFIFLILTVHELSHILIAHVFHYRVERVVLYPFGLSAWIPELGYGNVIKEVCILSSGPLVQVLFPIFFYVLWKWGMLSFSFYEYLCMINANILIFNLLPIYPLDGGRLLQSFFHSITYYKKAQQLTCLFSLILLILLFILQLLSGLSALVVEMFLLIQIISCWKEIATAQNTFYHYRLLHPIHAPFLYHNKHDLYRSRYNILKVDGGWVEEESWLKQRFRV